jgi:tetratricopeptide (TPR) repeat protein
MNLFKYIPLTAAEQKTLLKITFIAFTSSIGLVMAVWGIQKVQSGLSQQAKNALLKKTAQPNAAPLRIQPLDIEAHRFMAQNYLRNDQPQNAIRHLERLLEIEAEDRPTQVELATACLKAGVYAKALEIFASLIGSEVVDSLTQAIRARYGLALYNCGKVQESIRQLDECIQAYPSATEAFCYRGQIGAERNPDSQQPENDLQKAIALDSQFTEARYQLARLYMNRPNAQNAHYLAARDQLLRLLQVKPLDPRSHSRLGMIYYYLQQPSLAENSYKLSLTLNPEDYNTHYNLGELYFSGYNDDLRALEEFKKTVQLQPDHLAANFRIGIIALKNNDLNQAIRSFEIARNQAPENVRVLLQLAVAFEQKKLLPEAELIYKKILAVDELNEIARQKLSSVTALK